MKDGVQLISFNTFLKCNGLKKLHKQNHPVILDTTLVLKPKKLLFVATQKFEIESVHLSKDSNSPKVLLLRISPIK